MPLVLGFPVLKTELETQTTHPLKAETPLHVLSRKCTALSCTVPPLGCSTQELFPASLFAPSPLSPPAHLER